MAGSNEARGLLGAIQGAERRFVWLDTMSYARRLFAPEENVWADVARFVDVVRQGQRLLGSDVLEIGLDAFYTAPNGAGGSNRRPAAELRRMLRDEAPARRAMECARALRSLLPDTPIVVVVGGVARWLSVAVPAASGGIFGSEDLEDACVYLADVVRHFSTSGISGVTLDLRGDGYPDSISRAPIHAPIFNVARHHGWTTTVVMDETAGRFDVGDSVDVILQPSLQLASVPEARGVPIVGGGLTEAFWRDEPTSPLPTRALCYGEIPMDAAPERVLARLEALRT